ncbi:AMP-binding protein [uncultured Shimia sp.]|uniref:AMP-binding protein n=1 Tax=uncultured Shimia sp. TaxID=573152 RepID=UPI00260462E3|nr:AMP-binding protein [uncultured Shimia sp.]
MPLNQWFDHVVEKHASKPAVHTHDGQSISFSRLSEAADQISAALGNKGVRENSNVISTMDHLALNIAFWLAVWRLGGNVLASKSTTSFETAGVSVDAMLAAPGQDPVTGTQVLVFSPDILAHPVPKRP